ncbi:MAG TPA: hypothetical protein PKI12_08340 [Bacteroidales bacterium]|nr:hypothetical protein [Bacteroidales bacterium]
MKPARYIISTAIIALAVVSCRKIESLPPQPHIEFRSFSVFDTTDILGNNIQGGRLNFYFEDGDGDLGLDPPQFSTDDTVNLFFNLFRKTGGVFTEVAEDDDLNPSDYRIPYMDRTGQNKILKGTISVTFLYLFYDRDDTDTLIYEFYVKDRAQHYSDTIATCEIPLSVNGLYL